MPPPRSKIRPKPDGALWLAEFAQRIGVAARTLTGWQARGHPRAHPVPTPDGWAPDRGYLRPWWLEATVDEWHAARERVHR